MAVSFSSSPGRGKPPSPPLYDSWMVRGNGTPVQMSIEVFPEDPTTSLPAAERALMLQSVDSPKSATAVTVSSAAVGNASPVVASGTAASAASTSVALPLTHPATASGAHASTTGGRRAAPTTPTGTRSMSPTGHRAGTPTSAAGHRSTSTTPTASRSVAAGSHRATTPTGHHGASPSTPAAHRGASPSTPAAHRGTSPSTPTAHRGTTSTHPPATSHRTIPSTPSANRAGHTPTTPAGSTRTTGHHFPATPKGGAGAGAAHGFGHHAPVAGRTSPVGTGVPLIAPGDVTSPSAIATGGVLSPSALSGGEGGGGGSTRSVFARLGGGRSKKKPAPASITIPTDDHTTATTTATVDAHDTADSNDPNALASSRSWFRGRKAAPSSAARSPNVGVASPHSVAAGEASASASPSKRSRQWFTRRRGEHSAHVSVEEHDVLSAGSPSPVDHASSHHAPAHAHDAHAGHVGEHGGGEHAVARSLSPGQQPRSASRLLKSTSWRSFKRSLSATRSMEGDSDTESTHSVVAPSPGVAGGGGHGLTVRVSGDWEYDPARGSTRHHRHMPPSPSSVITTHQYLAKTETAHHDAVVSMPTHNAAGKKMRQPSVKDFAVDARLLGLASPVGGVAPAGAGGPSSGGGGGGGVTSPSRVSFRAGMTAIAKVAKRAADSLLSPTAVRKGLDAVSESPAEEAKGGETRRTPKGRASAAVRGLSISPSNSTGSGSAGTTPTHALRRGASEGRLTPKKGGGGHFEEVPSLLTPGPGGNGRVQSPPLLVRVDEHAGEDGDDGDDGDAVPTDATAPGQGVSHRRGRLAAKAKRVKRMTQQQNAVPVGESGLSLAAMAQLVAAAGLTLPQRVDGANAATETTAGDDDDNDDDNDAHGVDRHGGVDGSAASGGAGDNDDAKAGDGSGSVAGDGDGDGDNDDDDGGAAAAESAPALRRPGGFFDVVNNAADMHRATELLMRERTFVNKWTLVNLFTVVQTFFGLFMLVIGTFFGLTGFSNAVAIAIVIFFGVLITAFGAAALYLIRTGIQTKALLCIVLSVGLEVLAIAILGTLNLPARGNIVRLVLAGHGVTIAVVVLASVWVMRSARRAEEKLVLEMTLMMRMQQDRMARSSFKALGPLASQRIARMFRWGARVGAGGRCGGVFLSNYYNYCCCCCCCCFFAGGADAAAMTLAVRFVTVVLRVRGFVRYQTVPVPQARASFVGVGDLGVGVGAQLAAVHHVHSHDGGHPVHVIPQPHLRCQVRAVADVRLAAVGHHRCIRR